mgnify:FL=1
MTNQGAASISIPVKMYRGTERLIIAAAMAGMQPEEVEVEVTSDGTLSLLGRTVGELKGEKEVLLDEWNPGPYRRVLTLPNPVDAKLANVTYRNGVLVVVLPLATETRPAVLTLTQVGVAYGERVGSHGRPVKPTTAKEPHVSGSHGRPSDAT